MANQKIILALYREIYPCWSEEEIEELRDCNRRLLTLAMKQIDRLKREGRWPTDGGDEIRVKSEQTV